MHNLGNESFCSCKKFAIKTFSPGGGRKGGGGGEEGWRGRGNLSFPIFALRMVQNMFCKGGKNLAKLFTCPPHNSSAAGFPIGFCLVLRLCDITAFSGCSAAIRLDLYSSAS